MFLELTDTFQKKWLTTCPWLETSCGTMKHEASEKQCIYTSPRLHKL